MLRQHTFSYDINNIQTFLEVEIKSHIARMLLLNHKIGLSLVLHFEISAPKFRPGETQETH